uniref:Glycosyl transferase CAP10 domain-containing protein n=2 Tax=Clastoptera arizonana TaxID=38151 RepID=A0A1B6DS49_9HEMI
MKYSIVLFYMCKLIQLFDCNKSDSVSRLENIKEEPIYNLYKREDNERLTSLLTAKTQYTPCTFNNCSCYLDVILKDLEPFKKGITANMLKSAKQKGTRYILIGSKLYRDSYCMFPARCSGIEYFLLKIKNKLPDLDMIINTRDWPQVSRFHGIPTPVFSFSKTQDFLDIMYPTWGFWEGGPAIKLYPRGLGRWDIHRKSLTNEYYEWPWDKKKSIGFFRGSRTSSERDSLIMLSRESPSIVDAAYTKNQAWKSEQDTLFELPAEEVSLNEHCRYKYLFNFRGVAASFRLKHLFLCGSLVFHVGDEWKEFFYSSLKPWIHFIPVESTASKEDIRNLLEFIKEHDDLAKEIAERGREFIWDHLRMKDITCYWRALLRRYSKLLDFKPSLAGIDNMIEITGDQR